MEGDAGHRSPVSDIELGCIRGGRERRKIVRVVLLDEE